MLKKLVLALSVGLMVSAASVGQTVYFSDFEADEGGFVGTGDWERGIPVGADGSALGGFGGPEPIGGFSGDFAWGTVIGGLHNPSTISSLSQTFDFSGYTGTALTFYEWLDSGGNTFDMARVNVNGNEEYFADGGPTGDWRPVTLDLSAYDGLGAVTIDFEFSTTGVVERVGWYVDDVTISAVPEPASFGLLALAGLAFLRLRRR